MGNWWSPVKASHPGFLYVVATRESDALPAHGQAASSRESTPRAIISSQWRAVASCRIALMISCMASCP